MCPLYVCSSCEGFCKIFHSVLNCQWHPWEMIQFGNGFLQKERLHRLQESVPLVVVALIMQADMTLILVPSLWRQTGMPLHWNCSRVNLHTLISFAISLWVCSSYHITKLHIVLLMKYWWKCMKTLWVSWIVCFLQCAHLTGWYAANPY